MSHHAALPGPPLNHAHVVEAEREQHRLLEPLIDPPVAVGAASRRRAPAPRSSRSSAASTASRTAPLVAGPMPSRFSKASSMVLASSAWDMADSWTGQPRGCRGRAGEVKRLRTPSAPGNRFAPRPDALTLPDDFQESPGDRNGRENARARRHRRRCGFAPRARARPSPHGRQDAGDLCERAALGSRPSDHRARPPRRRDRVGCLAGHPAARASGSCDRLRALP